MLHHGDVRRHVVEGSLLPSAGTEVNYKRIFVFCPLSALMLDDFHYFLCLKINPK